MSLSRIAQFVIGLILAMAGLSIVLGGVSGLPGSWVAMVMGLACLALGIYVMMGGSFTI